MPDTGIGPALRRARRSRGKSLEEASRETRIRAEYLNALEGERFESFRGDVYVRGFLRSYSSYLGLDADRVLAVYNRHFGEPAPTLPDPEPAPPRAPRVVNPRLFPLRSRHPSWLFVAAGAALVIVVLAVGGMFRGAPAPAGGAPANAPSVPLASPLRVVVTVLTREPVAAIVTVDGARAFEGVLKGGEGRSWSGLQRITLRLSRGSVALVTVNGRSLGTPGTSGAPWSASFTPQDERGGGSPSPGSSP